MKTIARKDGKGINSFLSLIFDNRLDEISQNSSGRKDCSQNGTPSPFNNSSF